MAGTKISALGSLGTAADATIVPAVDSGTNYKLTGANLKAYVLSGTVTATNFAATSNGAGTSFKVGDDAWIGDINVSNSFGIRGVQNATQGYIVFGNANSTSYIGRNGTAPITVTGTFAGTANITAAGSFVSTATGSAATNGGQIVLNGATSNRIDFAGVGLGDPNASARSAGTKIVLWPQIDGSGVDYAIGLTSGVLWNSVHDETKSFKWFANASAVATLSGGGNLTVGNVMTTNGVFWSNGAVYGSSSSTENTTFTGTTTAALFKGTQITEAFTSVTPAFTSNIGNFDCSTGQIFNVTMTNAAANFTANLTNLGLSVGYLTTVSLVLNQSTSAYIPTAMTVSGSGTITYTWQGNSTPAGVPNRKDVVALNILCTAANTYTVFAQLVSF